jgi:hypothetical protein
MSAEITEYGDSLSFSQLQSAEISSQPAQRKPMTAGAKQPPAAVVAEFLPQPQQLVQPLKTQQQQLLGSPEHVQPLSAEVSAGFMSSEDVRQPQPFALGKP